MSRKNIPAIFFYSLLLCFLLLPCISQAEDANSAKERQLFENGVQLLNQGKYSEAANEFTQLIDAHPDMAGAYKNRGAAYMKLGLYPLAIMDFEKALLLDDNAMGLHSNLGVAYFYQGEYEKAIEHYDHEIKKIPKSYFAYFNRAICWSELGDLKKSLADTNKALEIKPDLYEAICFKGDILTKMKDTKKAKKAYQQAMKLSPDQTYAKEKLAQLQQGHSASGMKKKTPPAKEHQPDTRPHEKLFAIYELQAGACGERGNAEKICQTLHDLGYATRIIKQDMPDGKILYTVRTGKFLSRTDAAKGVKRFKQKTGIKAMIKKYTTRLSL